MRDITRPIEGGMIVYPGNPPVVVTTVQVADATHSALSAISLGSHTGTHIDAPSHLDAQGATTATYPLEQMNGPCEVIEVNVGSSGVIKATDLPPTLTSRVLLKTKNSTHDNRTFDPDFVALDDSAAAEVVARHLELIGIDAPSIKKKGVRDRVHRLLLEANIVILEGLWLTDVTPGQYELLCLPLSVALDGAPVRAVLRPRP